MRDLISDVNYCSWIVSRVCATVVVQCKYCKRSFLHHFALAVYGFHSYTSHLLDGNSCNPFYYVHIFSFADFK